MSFAYKSRKGFWPLRSVLHTIFSLLEVIMRKAIFILVFLFILSACSADLLDSNVLAYDNHKEDAFQNCRVASVVDGDTIKCEINGRIESVRLLLIDTPETKAPNKPVQPFGIEASEYAQNTLQDKNVVLEFDGPVRDKYDRLLAYIWVDDQLFNAMIVEQGLARVAYVYDPPYTHYDAIVQAESRAKALQTGIWSIDGYVTDEGY